MSLRLESKHYFARLFDTLESGNAVLAAEHNMGNEHRTVRRHCSIRKDVVDPSLDSQTTTSTHRKTSAQRCFSVGRRDFLNDYGHQNIKLEYVAIDRFTDGID